MRLRAVLLFGLAILAPSRREPLTLSSWSSRQRRSRMRLNKRLPHSPRGQVSWSNTRLRLHPHSPDRLSRGHPPISSPPQIASGWIMWRLGSSCERKRGSISWETVKLDCHRWPRQSYFPELSLTVNSALLKRSGQQVETPRRVAWCPASGYSERRLSNTSVFGAADAPYHHPQRRLRCCS